MAQQTFLPHTHSTPGGLREVLRSPTGGCSVHRSAHRTKRQRTCAKAASTLGGLSSLNIRTLDVPVQTVADVSAEGPCAGGVCQHAHKLDETSLRKLFNHADTDGNGVLDREELRCLLQRTNGGLEMAALDWLSEAELGEAMSSYDTDGSGDISFDEFLHMANDGAMLSGKLDEYRVAFRAVDVSGNGTIAASEIEAMLKKLGQPVTARKLFQIMERFDRDASGQIEFNEFLRMFRDELLDLKEILDYIRLNPARRTQGTAYAWPQTNRLVDVNPGQVINVYSEAEFDQILRNYPTQLTCIQASLTWCRPCLGFEKTYERFASLYKNVIFIKFYGNSNKLTKFLFEERLNTSQTPEFTFFRDGHSLGRHHGANAEKLEVSLQTHVQPGENPAARLSRFQKQAWRARLGLKRS